MTGDQLRRHLADGTELFEKHAQELDDLALAGPSRLPGWSRAHVVGHIARNADALVNLLIWASTGVETPMYRSPEQRAADIEAAAAQSPAELRADLLSADRRLAQTLADLPPDGWQATVRNARGEEITGADVPVMRVRELWIHLVDLDAGVEFADWPPDLLRAVIDDVAPAFGRRSDVPDVVLDATDSDGSWRLGSGGQGTTVSGTLADLAAYLLGRPVRGTLSGEIPSLPRWL
jgi:maleylpyruvate isomerase